MSILLRSSTDFIKRERGESGRPLAGIRPSHQPKGPPLVLFYELHFRPNNPITYWKALSAPIYTNFEGQLDTVTPIHAPF